MTWSAPEAGSNGQGAPVASQAVIQTRDATLGLVLWGAVTSHGIEEVWDSVIRIAAAEHQPVDVEDDMSRRDDRAHAGSKVLVLERFRGRHPWPRDLARRRSHSFRRGARSVLLQASKATRRAHDLFHRLAQQTDDPATFEMSSLFARISLMQTTAIEDRLGD